MKKKEVTKEEYKQVVDEILYCREQLEKNFGKYMTNSIDRLIMARIKIEQITINREVTVADKDTRGKTE